MEKFEIVEIARMAALEAVAHRDKILQEELDARYHDVKLLLINYRKLKAYYANITPEVLDVSAICSLRHKTKLMMSHVDKMLIVYESLCRAADNPDEYRRWEALYLRYISDERISVESISEKLGVDKRTFYRDVGKAMEDMAVLLFGLEAIGTWKPNRKR